MTKHSTNNIQCEFDGTRLYALRVERGITMMQLAKALGMSESTISFYESGDRTPSFEACGKICNFFGCDLNYLFGTSDQKLSSMTGVGSNNRAVPIFDRNKLIKDYEGNGSAVFDPNFTHSIINLPDDLLMKNKSYFAIKATEGTLRNDGINPDDICIFAACEENEISNNKIVCAVLKGKTVIKKYYKTKDALLLYSGGDEDPIKVTSKKQGFIVGKLALVLSDRQ